MDVFFLKHGVQATASTHSIRVPLLFVLYINELAETLRTYGVIVRLFADDLKMPEFSNQLMLMSCRQL